MEAPFFKKTKIVKLYKYLYIKLDYNEELSILSLRTKFFLLHLSFHSTHTAAPEQLLGNWRSSAEHKATEVESIPFGVQVLSLDSH